MPLTQLYTPIREEDSVEAKLKRSASPLLKDGPSSKRRVEREVAVDLGFHSQAAGSCLFHLGSTKALVIVQGPCPISGGGADSSSSESLKRGHLAQRLEPVKLRRRAFHASSFRYYCCPRRRR